MLIAITGGIGSGKTAVMDIIASFNAKVLSADNINNQLLLQESYINQLAALFDDVYVDGRIDKVALGKIVFYDAQAMQKLNDIAHPAIIAEIKRQAEEIGGTVFVEVPLLVESNMQSMFDKIWLVKASNSLRIKRIILRDLISEDYAIRIMATQATDKIRMRYATDIIENNGDESVLKARVKELYNSLFL